jgi:tetratricopeptide (TPR) repeat protein
MDCNITILRMEASLLVTRANSWMLKNIGRDQELFKRQQTDADTQQLLIENCFRFIHSLIAASDLARETTRNAPVIKSVMARCLHMVEIMANSLYTHQRHRDFIKDIRVKLKDATRLLKFVTSVDYIVTQDDKSVLASTDYLLKLGAPALHLWGEALEAYAETSLKYWKAQYMECLKLAEDRLAKCLVISPKRHQSLYLLGSVLLLQAKASTDTLESTELLQKAKGAFTAAVQLLPMVKGYNYSLAKVCALLNQEEECCKALKTFISLSPSNAFSMLDEPAFDRLRTCKWFYDLIEQVASSKTITNPSPNTTYQHHQPTTTTSSTEDKRYSLLQSSLIESGFSIKKLLELITWLPVSSGHPQVQVQEDNEYVRKQKERLQQRLELYQLRPKRDIPSDGNCQMHAISDQLYDTIERSAEVRRLVVDWLRKNRNLQLPNGAILHQFVHDRKWEEYCDGMAKDGCWGDHLTLLAISEMFGVVISVISSVEGDNFITEIHPTQKKMNRVLLLSHYAEFHYGSLTHVM